jgi:hypothetical protein
MALAILIQLHNIIRAFTCDTREASTSLRTASPDLESGAGTLSVLRNNTLRLTR